MRQIVDLRSPELLGIVNVNKMASVKVICRIVLDSGTTFALKQEVYLNNILKNVVPTSQRTQHVVLMMFGEIIAVFFPRIIGTLK
jgi:hypothetical protein